ncbi:MAG TPA: sensor histidine kinase, partial [Paracoccus sp. (in: a-proteobacteria)]|nr:sensor histidine kinase [Paracoccus sp. (in: a-proteobacteria)]
MMPLGLINLRAALGADAQPDPIRPRTLIALRWVALAGQLAAVAGGLAMGARFALAPVLAVVAASAALNLWLGRSGQARITGPQALGQLSFDTV